MENIKQEEIDSTITRLEKSKQDIDSLISRLASLKKQQEAPILSGSTSYHNYFNVDKPKVKKITDIIPLYTWVINTYSNKFYQIMRIDNDSNYTLKRYNESLVITKHEFTMDYKTANENQKSKHINYLNSKNFEYYDENGLRQNINDDLGETRERFRAKAEAIKVTEQNKIDITKCDFYMITCNGDRGSKVRHTKYEHAEKEAIRLCKTLNTEAFIVGVVASVKPIVTHEIIKR